MKTLKVLSLLLSYPRPEALAALGEMAEVVAREELLPEPQTAAVLGLIERFRSTEPMALQEEYVALFDRGRALSLHLFEHVHGESRERGQAMVDLMALYQSHGFHINARELPDYLPLFLEYLSQRPADEARALLGEAVHVITLVGARLRERASPYHVLFDALQAFAGEPEDAQAIREQARTEGPDETLVHMDRIWEEAPVSFAPAAGCGGDTIAPVQWLPRRDGESR
jgi:nitrate reductase delta subunit